MMLGGVTEPEPNVRLSKNDSKIIKIGQKYFFGGGYKMQNLILHHFCRMGLKHLYF